MAENETVEVADPRGDKIRAQIAFCKSIGTEYFAPLNGKCYRCGRDIYEKISLEDAGTRLVTGCRHCHYSFVS